jgi:hypothetical protein
MAEYHNNQLFALAFRNQGLFANGVEEPLKELLSGDNTQVPRRGDLIQQLCL